VALKLVKAGINTREVIARFESERQALALMNHPAIARVFDADSTSQGAPYFVMDVAGVSITNYCDLHRLGTRDRLELFLHVCEGVQHAHQKAIIHRDLKPANILVTEVDGKAVPKIIDFGVAKALAQKLTADTIYTRVGTMIGTPDYMSPEQALSLGEDIDTRSDVYLLGIIFYELLAGAPAFGAAEDRFRGIPVEVARGRAARAKHARSRPYRCSWAKAVRSHSPPFRWVDETGRPKAPAHMASSSASISGGRLTLGSGPPPSIE
jgi:non-specific serine/threonine protein kinase/serine/threonine-protein kinase